MSGNTLSSISTLIDAISAIEATNKRLAVVLSDGNHILGTLTDGDIRRYILQGHTLEALVTEAMNKNPTIASENASDSTLREMLSSNNIRSLPLVNGENKYVRTLHENELSFVDKEAIAEKTFSAAVIMAGGEGTRLMPLTENMPKPMVVINGLPLLERQIRRLCNMSITQVYISVNYLSEVIEDYFGDGRKFGVEIFYLHEDRKLGTAGALSLLPYFDNLQSSLVLNGDVLTTSDFINLFHFHEEHQSVITIGAVDYHVEIPYGVIQYDGAKVKSLQEKPSQHFFCNAGIYALASSVLKKIPENQFWNMTDLIEQCLTEDDIVSVFPVHEYWSDIGTPADLEKAREEFKGIYK
ncbi:MAG: dTDP-glucose pyrophosphorylase [Paraglaciecola sp.]|jgi:dTDP-glucose pyrophosphorylase